MTDKTKKTKKAETGSMFLRPIDLEVREAFKIYCIKKGKSMTKMIEGYMRRKTGMELEEEN